MFRTIALTGFAALMAATTISLAPPARAQIGNIFSDPAPRPPGSHSPRQPASSPTTKRKCRRCRRAGCCRRPTVRRRGRACRRRVRCSRSRWRRRRASPSFRRTRRRVSRWRRRNPVRASRWRRRPHPLPGLPPGQRQPKGVPQTPGHAAAGRRGGVRAAGAEDRQQEGELFRARQDHRPHHQFR